MYVSEQTSEQLRAHMRRLKKMPGWHEPLADRLWEEVQDLDSQLATVIRKRDDLKADNERLRAALRDAIASGTVYEWRPIETAPRDGTKIIVWDRSSGYVPWVFYDVIDGTWTSEFLRWGGIPTHWMPLPYPPCAALEGKDEK